MIKVMINKVQSKQIETINRWIKRNTLMTLLSQIKIWILQTQQNSTKKEFHRLIQYLILLLKNPEMIVRLVKKENRTMKTSLSKTAAAKIV